MSRKLILDLFLQSMSVCTDTRNIIPGSIFFALKGANFDGNVYVHKAIEEGCSYAVLDNSDYHSGEQTILVEDVLTSLQNLALDYRNTLQIPIIGITGSNGKTTTKELLRDVLLKKYKVFATHGNLNNHIGVPLSLLSIKKETEIAIIEMGANHQKEIAFLSEIARPDYGLITNIGKAHLEGFGGIEGVKKGKGELFDFLRANKGYIFVNENTEYIPKIAEGIQQSRYQSQGGVFQIQITQESPTLSFSWANEDETFDVKTNFTGLYNLDNMAAAIAVGIHFGVKTKDISDALSNYIPENNRSQLKKTDKNTLILDAYNANPSSVKNAVMNLNTMPSSNKYFVLGDMLELGDYAEVEHKAIVDLCTSLNLQGIYVGPIFSKIIDKKDSVFSSAEEAMTYLEELELKNHTILIKGSRGIRLEVLTKVL